MNSTGLFFLAMSSCGLLLVSGYFYGCVYQKFIKALRKIDATMVGVLTIFGLFQMETFFSISTNASSRIALFWLIGLLILGPVLAAMLRADLKPKKGHLFSLVSGLIVSILICAGSAHLNTNSIFFDTITYLSETVESSQAVSFGYMDYLSGIANPYAVDAVHSFTGFYYLWGMICRVYQNVFHLKAAQLTPIYIWGSTITYGMMTGELIAASARLLWKKNSWKNLLIVLLISCPYFTNYFNTTLAFFGNTFRMTIIGWSFLLVYLILSKKDARLFLPLTLSYYAVICATSSGFFLAAMITAGLLMELAAEKEKKLGIWIGFIVSIYPILHYAVLILKADLVSEYVLVLLGCAAVSAILLLAAYLLRNHFEGFDRLASILGILAFAGLIGISFLLRNGEYGYSYFFKEQSEMMSMNLFNHFSTRELIRNLIYYMLFAFAFLHHGEGMRMKRFILFLILLFVNPLVTPAVCRFMTSEVYFRVFDLVLNPFVIVFLVYHASFFVPGRILNPEYHFILCFISAVIGLMNLMNYYSKSLIYKDPGWDWKLKASNDSMELYDFIQTNLSDTENKPSILSQDINLKGYVTGITLPFTSADYREVLADPEQYADKTDLVQLLYPSMRYTDQNPFGTELNYDNLPQVILNEGADYLLISNVTSVWNPRGWYDKVYLKMINSGLCTMEYQNDTWALLKISKDYQAEGQEGN